MNAIIKFAIVAVLVISVVSMAQTLIPTVFTSTIHTSMVTLLTLIYKVDNIIPAQPIINSIKIFSTFFASLCGFILVLWVYDAFKD